MTNDDAYRQPDEKSPQPTPPGRFRKWATAKWKWYVGALREHGALLFAAAHFIAILVVFTVGLLVSIAYYAAASSISEWHDPCAEYVSVQVDATTVDGTAVKIPVSKCLRLKSRGVAR